MAKHDSRASLQTELAQLREDKQYEFFQPLLDVLEPLANQPEDERDRDFAKGLLAVIKQLQGERQRGADVRTHIEKMAGGFIQPEWNIDGDVKQANRDFVINNIINVFQQYGSKLGDFVPEAGRARALSDTKAEQRYRERVVREHQHLDIFGRAKPLDLEKIYISLRVGEYVPVEERPDESSRNASEARPQQRSGIIEATEALYLKPPRLAILGDPGSGKTTLLRYLALKIAEQNRTLGDWARKIMPPGTAQAVDRIQRKLDCFNAQLLVFFAGILALVLWSIGVFRSSSWVLAALAGLVLAAAMFYVYLIRLSRQTVRIFTAAGVFCLIGSAYFELVPSWAIGTTGAALLVQLYPYWIAAPLAWLKKRRDGLTRYPLPFYLTLNDVARGDSTLEGHLAQELQKGNFAHPGDFLRQKLDKGECVVLLDALDEVMEDDAYRLIAKEIAKFSGNYDRVPVVVTCRTAGFRDHRTVLRGFIRLEVQEFTNQEVERFIRSWFGNPQEPTQSLSDGLLQSLGRSARMRQLASNPLLLTMICLLYERDLHLPERRVELYERCADELLEKIETERGLDAHAQFPAEKKRKALQDLACRFHGQGLRVFGQEPLLKALETVLPALGYDATRKSEFLRELMERSGLIRQQSKTSYSFAHFTFQEFFTAEHLHAQGKGELPLDHQSDPWWREVILLYVGLQPDATILLRRLKERDVLLAADALADVKDPGTRYFQEVAAEIIGVLKNLVESDSDRRQDAADRLAATGKWGASDYLVERVRGGGKKVISLAAVLALDRAGDRTVLAGLCEPLAPMLCLLTGHLGKVSRQLDERILSLLDRFGLPMVFVPGGEFLMGEDSSPLRLDNYWIGKFPVTNTLYQRFTNETEYKVRGGWPRDFKPGKENHPAVWLNFHDAVEFCKWSGTMLPSEAEWEKAARGTDGRRYPWGEQWDSVRCNVSGRGTTPVDAYPNGISPYGCFDIDGNVKEWTRSHHKPYPYDPADGREALDAPESVKRVLRGGSWRNNQFDAHCSYRFRLRPHLGYLDYGFRVVVSPISAF